VTQVVSQGKKNMLINLDAMQPNANPMWLEWLATMPQCRKRGIFEQHGFSRHEVKKPLDDLSAIAIFIVESLATYSGDHWQVKAVMPCPPTARKIARSFGNSHCRALQFLEDSRPRFSIQRGSLCAEEFPHAN
jgi:hypothetical protein